VGPQRGGLLRGPGADLGDRHRLHPGLRGGHPVYWRTAPTLKHWLAHNNETDRDTVSASVRPRVLHEYDLRAFRSTVEAGAVAGVMPAYNLVNGRPNHLSPYLREHLRGWAPHPLLVVSDAGAPSNLVDSEHYFDDHEEATAAALRAGVDSFTDHGTDSGPILARVRGALARGLLTEADVDEAVRHQLAVRFSLGEFDPELDPYAAEDGPEHAHDTPEHQELALLAAERCAVLLRNEGLLPLAAGTRIAVVGPLADEAKLDWYSGAFIRRSTPLDGLRERFGVENVSYADGADRVRLRAANGAGLTAPDPAAVAAASSSAGDPVAVAAGAEGSLDPALLAGRTDLPPLTAAPDGGPGSVFVLTDWGGGVLTLRAPDGRYVSVAEDGLLRASAEQPGGWVVQETFRLEPVDASAAGQGDQGDQGEGAGRRDGAHRLVHLATGAAVRIGADGVAHVPVPHPDADGNAAAGNADGNADGAPDAGEVFTVETVERGADVVARLAAEADAVVVVAGNDPHINGRETEDRLTLRLPEDQDRLWRTAAAANPDTALVLVSSYPYAVPEAAAALPALLWTAHGGQAAGTALARLLAGDVSPSGRLPQTWYAADADLAGLKDYDVIGSRQTYLYFDGTPLYPFGHGLSYASFGYGDLTVTRPGGGERPGLFSVAFTVTNTGTVTADEVAQLYVRAEDPAVARPHRELAGFRRLTLAPGASERVTLTVPYEALGHWDPAHGRWTVPPGEYTLLAGASSADTPLSATVRVDGDPVPPRPVLGGRPVRAADFDEQHGAAIVDLTKVSGDAVCAEDGEAGAELVFRRCDFGAGLLGVTLSAAAEGGPGTVGFALADGGTLTVEVRVAETAGRYTYTEVAASLAPLAARGVRDLRVVLRGPVRLADLRFTAQPGEADSGETA
jgi:beta-glucosidase